MNQLINKYLTSMEFYVNFSLDENFDETIKSRFRDNFNYESFSEGEKMRIDGERYYSHGGWILNKNEK